MKRFVLVAAVILGLACGARAQDGPIQGTTTNVQGQARPGTNVAICQNLATTGASVTNNIVTYTFGSNPQTLGFVIGATLTVFGFTGGDTSFNGTFTISATSATTISANLNLVHAPAGTNGNVYQTGSTSQACAAIATTFTDQTGLTTTPNPFTSDGLGNYLTFVAPGYYRVQLYGPGVTTLLYPTAVACVPNNSVNCGALLGTPNTWTALQTFSTGITSGGTGTIGGTWGGAPTLSGLWTFNAGVTSAGPNTLNGGGTTSGAWTHSGQHTFIVQTNVADMIPSAAGLSQLGTSSLPFNRISIGSAANQQTLLTSLATTNRTVSWPDETGTAALAGSSICGTPQGPLGAVTGTGAAASYFSGFTIPAKALGVGGGVRLTVLSKHTTGTAAVNYQLSFGGTITTATAPAGSANQIDRIVYIIKNNAGVQNAQTILTDAVDSNAGTVNLKLDTAAIDTTSGVVVQPQFNVANTDQITPEQLFCDSANQ